MKKVVFFLLVQISVTALIPKADLSQLSLLGNLYKHFSSYHLKQESSSTLQSFLDFVIEHYGNMDREHEKQHENEHEELPFKHFNSCIDFLAIEQQIEIRGPSIYSAAHLTSFFSINEIEFYKAIDHPPATGMLS